MEMMGLGEREWDPGRAREYEWNLPQTHSALLPQQVAGLEAIVVCVWGVLLRSGRFEVELMGDGFEESSSPRK